MKGYGKGSKGMKDGDSKSSGKMKNYNGIGNQNSKKNIGKYGDKDSNFKGGTKENYPLG
jgi:hypothetical protein